MVLGLLVGKVERKGAARDEWRCFFTLSVAVPLVALRLYQANLAAIMGWPHREVQPDGAMAILLYQQFILPRGQVPGRSAFDLTERIVRSASYRRQCRESRRCSNLPEDSPRAGVCLVF